MALIHATTVARVMTSESHILPSKRVINLESDRELTKTVEPYIKQEDEGKFRCKTCQKLFKATSFVEKHIANKHSELVKSLDDVIHSFGMVVQSLIHTLGRSLTSTILHLIPIESSPSPIRLNLLEIPVKPLHRKPTASRVHLHIMAAIMAAVRLTVVVERSLQAILLLTIVVASGITMHIKQDHQHCTQGSLHLQCAGMKQPLLDG